MVEKGQDDDTEPIKDKDIKFEVHNLKNQLLEIQACGDPGDAYESYLYKKEVSKILEARYKFQDAEKKLEEAIAKLPSH